MYHTLLVSAVIELDLLNLKLVRIIALGIRNYLPILMFLGLFVLDLWANIRLTHHVTSRC